MMGQIVAADDAENLRLCRKLHDTAGQQLVALLLELRRIQSRTGIEFEVKTAVESIEGIAQDIGAELHHIALALRSRSLADHGLAVAVATFLDEWSDSTQLQVSFDAHALGKARLPRHVELTLYRIITELLLHIGKQPGAAHVSVILARRADRVDVVIEDPTARGLALDATMEKGPGVLAIAAARAALLGGALTVEAPADGTASLFVWLPLAGPGIVPAV
jgi:signal transduction histidine kinase